MATRTISGTVISNGYTLSGAYSLVSVTSTGTIEGAGGLAGQSGGAGGQGGVGVWDSVDASIYNAGLLLGGLGGAGGVGTAPDGDGGVGGAGGAGAYFIGYSLTNTNRISGGAGGQGGRTVGAGGVGGGGGAGGAGLAFAYGQMVNQGTILGGHGGNGSASGLYGGAGGVGGAGVVLGANSAMVFARGTFLNSGAIVGGLGGIGGTGTAKSGASGSAGDGVFALNGDFNLLNGTAAGAEARVTGAIGVYGAVSATLTFTNFGTIRGTGGVAVDLLNSGDRMVAEKGSAVIGMVEGGGASLDLASGSGTVTGLGVIGTVSGGQSMTFSGFGHYDLATGSTWTLVGSNKFTKPVFVEVYGSVTNTGNLYGGAYTYAEGGDASGPIVVFNGLLTNKLTIQGGAGLTGASGNGGFGGGGVAMHAGTIVNEQGAGIMGGAGGAAGSGSGDYAGSGGVGISAIGYATITNKGSIVGGVGGAGGGAGGNGVYALDGGLVINFGTIEAGAGGAGGGRGGVGVDLMIGSSLVNGSSTSAKALIEGYTGVTGSTFSGSQVTNFGTIVGTGKDSVVFSTRYDRLIAEAGSVFIGAVLGGGGTLELASGTGTITGLGATATISGGESMTLSGFGRYQIDAGRIWTLAGENLVAAGKTVTDAGNLAVSGTLTNDGTINGGLTLKSSSARLIVQGGSQMTGTVAGGGGTLELTSATGTITGLGATGTISGGESMTFGGFGGYQLDKGGAWTVAGVNSVGVAQILDLSAGASLVDSGTLTSKGALTLSGTVTGTGALVIDGGTATIDAGAAVSVSNWTMSGGTVILNEALTFKGAFAEAAGATLTLGSKVDLTLSGPSSLEGLISGAGTIAVAKATVASLTIGGTDDLSVTGTVSQTGAVTVGGATTVAANLSIAKGATWAIGGAFAIGHGASASSRLNVMGTFIGAGDAGVSTVNVNTYDTGLVEAASGTLEFQRELVGSGSLKIDGGAILEVDTSAASTLSVLFNGTSATLAVAAPSEFAATITGFAVTDTVELLGKKATGASINALDQLVIVNGTTTVAALQLTGTYSGATFKVGSDGKGGTDVTLLTTANSRPPPAASLHSMVVAMASLGPSAMSEAVSTPVDPVRPTLLVPRGT